MKKRIKAALKNSFIIILAIAIISGSFFFGTLNPVSPVYAAEVSNIADVQEAGDYWTSGEVAVTGDTFTTKIDQKSHVITKAGMYQIEIISPKGENGSKGGGSFAGNGTNGSNGYKVIAEAAFGAGTILITGGDCSDGVYVQDYLHVRGGNGGNGGYGDSAGGYRTDPNYGGAGGAGGDGYYGGNGGNGGSGGSASNGFGNTRYEAYGGNGGAGGSGGLTPGVGGTGGSASAETASPGKNGANGTPSPVTTRQITSNYRSGATTTVISTENSSTDYAKITITYLRELDEDNITSIPVRSLSCTTVETEESIIAKFPSEIIVNALSGVKTLPVIWDMSTFDITNLAEQTVYGEVTLSGNLKNPMSLKAELKITIREPSDIDILSDIAVSVDKIEKSIANTNAGTSPITVVKGKAFSVWTNGNGQPGTDGTITVINNDTADNYVNIVGVINQAGTYETVINGTKYIVVVIEEPISSNVSVVLN